MKYRLEGDTGRPERFTPRVSPVVRARGRDDPELCMYETSDGGGLWLVTATLVGESDRVWLSDYVKLWP